MALPTTVSVIIMVTSNLLFSPNLSSGEPSVFTKLFMNSEQALEFECHVHSSVSVQVMHLMDMDPMTASAPDVKSGPNSVIHSRVVHQWNETTEFTCLISHPTLAFQSSSTTRFNPGSLKGDGVGISPNYVILLESTQEKSRVSFQCDTDFYFDEAVTWSIQPKNSILDETLSGLNGTMISVEIETGLNKSVITFETIDLPSDVYRVSCSTRPMMGSLVIEEARLEISPWNRLDSYNILVPFLIAISGLFSIAFLILGCYVVISKKLRKRQDTCPSVSDEVERTDLNSADNHSLASPLPPNGLSSIEVTEDVGLAVLSAQGRREQETASEIYYYSENELDDPIPRPRDPHREETEGEPIPRLPDRLNQEVEEYDHQYENRDQIQRRKQMSATDASSVKAY